MPDARSPACRSLTYDKDLPRASVIISELTILQLQIPLAFSYLKVFTDEYFSVLVRTVHSVVNRTPKHLLREIVLVDDFSQRGKITLLQYSIRSLELIFSADLGEPLVAHLRRFGTLVRLFRAHERLGLIRAKLAGAKFARGDVVVFLDSHCEASEGWWVWASVIII